MIPPDLPNRNGLAYRAARNRSGPIAAEAIDGSCPTSTEPLAGGCSGIEARVTAAVPHV
jgi:hypothetical protein